MSICPVCNGFDSVIVPCRICTINMIDEGKLSDFFDDYSPYMEIDLLRLEDGYPQNFHQSQCVHLLQCPACGRQETYFIRE
ncbi:hypothetical protein P5F75_15210 [Caldifermentibacillus hisashii]|nr:hypothetical protein [Caldibacillus thermoamylovorans]MED3644715.1 hypothetical protein [Caldifermentibacillus hisashii]